MAKGRTKDTHTRTHDKCVLQQAVLSTLAHRDMQHHTQTGEQQVMVINFAYAKGSTHRKDELKLPKSDWGRLQSALQSVAHRIYYEAVKQSV